MMSISLPVLPAEASGGSPLCISCGLCCTELMHFGAILYPEDDPIVRRLGLIRIDRNGHDEFLLPCHHLKNNCCSVYPDRPRICSEYTCHLLQRYLLKEITLADALEIVESTRAGMIEVRREIGSEVPSTVNIWEGVEKFAELRREKIGEAAFLRSHGAFMVRAFRLRDEVRKQFVPKDQG